MCTLHSGGKFNSKVYETSGGLHGVGVSVVNALSSLLEVEVAREQKLYKMSFERGHPKGKLQDLGKINNRRGTRIRFKPDTDIFGAKAAFKPQRLFKMARSKAYLFGGVKIRWRCDPALLKRHRRGARRGRIPLRRRPEGLSRRRCPRRHAGAPGYLLRQIGPQRRPWRLRMGGRLDRGRRRLPLLLLQHGADARRRHARIRHAQRDAARPERPRRAHRPGQARRPHHLGRRHGGRCRDALGVRARAGIPGPDQGPPCHRGSPEDRRTGDQGSVRSLAVGQSAAGQQAAGFRHRARRRAAAPPRREGNFTQDRGEEAPPPRQACGLHQHRHRRLRALHRRGRLRPAAVPNRRATARPRRSCPCAEKSSTSPPPARTS